MSTKAIGYTLWLMPDTKAYTALNKIIKKLSTTYSTPYFEPHVTLLGQLSKPQKEIIAKAEKIAKQISPFTIQLKKIHYANDYFYSLFVQTDRSHSIMNANKIARETFHKNTGGKYRPHLSLLYGKLLTRTKKEIIQNLKSQPLISFTTKKLYVVESKGDVKTWKVVKKLNLKK